MSLETKPEILKELNNIISHELCYSGALKEYNRSKEELNKAKNNLDRSIKNRTIQDNKGYYLRYFGDIVRLEVKSAMGCLQDVSIETAWKSGDEEGDGY